MKVVLTISLVCCSFFSNAQQVQVLSAEKDILHYAIDNMLQYSFSTNERNLRVLSVEARGFNSRYTFNKNGLCFNQFIEITDKRIVPLFEKYLTQNFSLEFNEVGKDWGWTMKGKYGEISVTKGEMLGNKVYNCLAIMTRPTQ
ncbi:hypothetical protein EPD60_07590 [Flaviaesturariibacter flavus]|uniref:Uncharacterized protein n=1 Tax=Flaviaesturariibacter flavus TaxID=2502780 RepID=A0A4R1BG85_9BACT|nr:hypothetical protein [Flaviaesturariibacter flavus]TCJ16201.1 hypothetical protein EPD60_07590 [Flaviaesturariibacter flavus]